jgi:DNA recombination protein RmuC
MDPLTVFTLALVLIILVTVLLLYHRLSKPPDVVVDPETMKGAIITSWKELKIDEDIGAIKTRAEDILHTSQDLQSLFKVTRGRGEYGEFQLEQILKDMLPSQYLHIRERLPIGTPDAHIKTPQGILCIDSKFPLDNYRKMLEAKEKDQQEKLGKIFRSDVQKHIDTIKAAYVKPQEGTTPVAFGFIPSEAVYQYLTECEMGLLADAAKDGVMLVSPATTAANLNLLSMGLQALEISERAKQIQKNLGRLSNALTEVEEPWNTLRSHLTHAYNKAIKVNDRYNRLKLVFERITQQEEET